MKRREFLTTSSALMATMFAPNLFAKESFTIYGAPALPSIVIAVALLQGKINRKVSTSLEIWKNPDQLRAGVASGKFKVMMSPSNVAVNLRNQGQNVAMFNNLTNGINSLMVKDKSIKAPEDLIGKKLIMPFKNDMPDIVFRALFRKLNIDISKIDISYAATPPEAVTHFLTKDYDATFLPEPMASVTILRGKQRGLSIYKAFDFLDFWGEAFKTKPLIPQAGIIVDVDYYDKNRALFDILQSDLEDALKWIMSNKQSAANIGSSYLPAPIPAIAQSLESANLSITRARDIKDEAMKFFEIIMEFNPKLIGSKLPDKSFFI